MTTSPLRDYVTSGMVTLEIVNALLPFGEPVLTDTREFGDTFPFRAWMRLRVGGRVFGPSESTAQLAAEALLQKLRGTLW